MMSKLTAQGNKQNKQFKPIIYQGKRRGQMRNHYNKGNYQNRYRSNSGDRRMSFRVRAQYGQNYRGRLQYVDNYRNNFRRGNLGKHKIIQVSIVGVDIEAIIEMSTLEEVEVGLGEDSIQVILDRMIKAVVAGQDQVQEPVLIEIELDVSNVGNMIILLKTVQTQKTEREPEQIEQMYNLDKDKTVFKFLVADMYYDLIRTNSDDGADHLNL